MYMRYASICMNFLASLYALHNAVATNIQVSGKTGPETKEVLLEDHDPVWLELRHAHIADVSFTVKKSFACSTNCC